MLHRTLVLMFHVKQFFGWQSPVSEFNFPFLLLHGFLFVVNLLLTALFWIAMIEWSENSDHSQLNTRDDEHDDDPRGPVN